MTDANVKPTSPTSQWGGLWYSGEKPTSLDDEKLFESELPASPARRSMCVHTENSKIEFILGDATTKFTHYRGSAQQLSDTPPLTHHGTRNSHRRLDTTAHRVSGHCDLRAPHLVIDIAHLHPLGHISRLGLAAYCTEWPKAHSHMRRAVHAAAHTLSLAPLTARGAPPGRARWPHARPHPAGTPAGEISARSPRPAPRRAA